MKNKICGAIAGVAFLALLGFTGTAENGGDMGTYIVRALICLIILIAAIFAITIEVQKK